MPQNKKTLPKTQEVNKSHPKKTSYRFKWAVIAAAVVLITLILALLIQTNTIANPLRGLLAKEQTFSISDDCSLIVGQLIHTIASDDVCEMRCKTYCQTREISYTNHLFTTRQNDCNVCECSCT